MRFGALTSPAALGVVTRGLSAREASKQCTNMTIPVTLAARNAVFNVPTLSNNLDATTFFQNVSNIGGNFTEESLVDYRDETGTYNISAQYCTNGSDPTTLLFLTHGIGFDKSYVTVPYLCLHILTDVLSSVTGTWPTMTLHTHLWTAPLPLATQPSPSTASVSACPRTRILCKLYSFRRSSQPSKS